MQPSDKQKNRLSSLMKVEENPDFAIYEKLEEVNENLEKMVGAPRVNIEGAETVLIKGKQGDVGPEPSDERLVELITPLIPEPIKGDK